MASKKVVIRAATAVGAAAAVSDVALCDAPGWELVAPTEIDEAAAMITPSAGANALMSLGTELAKDARVQEALGERLGLGGGAPLRLTEETGGEVLKRLTAELDLMREELEEQQDLNSSLLTQNEELRKENDLLKDDAPLPQELLDCGLQFPAEAFESATLEGAAESTSPDELDYTPPPRGETAEGVEAEQDGEDAEPDQKDNAEEMLTAALGVAAVIVLFCILRKCSPEKAQRAGKVCASVLTGAWAFLKGQRRAH